MVIQPLIGNPYNGYINLYYWVDDHPLLYGNNGSLDPGTIVFGDLRGQTKKSLFHCAKPVACELIATNDTEIIQHSSLFVPALTIPPSNANILAGRTPISS